MNEQVILHDEVQGHAVVAKIKTCTRCGSSHPAIDFPRDKQKSDGRASICTQCNREKAIAWALKNVDRNRARSAAWQKANQSRVKELKIIWRAKNADYKREADRNWRQSNPERVRLHSSARRARVRKAEGVVSPDIVQKLKLLQRGKCPCCGLSLGKDFHLDHIVPLIQGGKHDDSNLQLLRKKCNLQKNRRDPVEFMQSRGLLL